MASGGAVSWCVRERNRTEFALRRGTRPERLIVMAGSQTFKMAASGFKQGSETVLFAVKNCQCGSREADDRERDRTEAGVAGSETVVAEGVG